MAASPILDWSAEKEARFGHALLRFRHDLAHRPLFGDAALAEALDRYPRHRLGVYAMGEEPADWASWRRCEAGDLGGAQLIEAVAHGRLWLNLRGVDAHLPEYARLSAEITADLRAHGVVTFRRDLGLLIASPGAMVLYHLDVPLTSLWQVRGEKRIWFYPRAEPYVATAQIERFVRQEAEGQLPFDPAWDEVAEVCALAPGDMITWPQNAPHRVTNGPMINVALSLEFMTAAAALRANILWANGLIRRLGVTPQVEAGLCPSAAAKLALARLAKAVAPRRAWRPILPAACALDPARPGALKPL